MAEGINFFTVFSSLYPSIVSEPVLLKNGNFGLKTYSRLYNKKGEFDSTLYSNLNTSKESG